VLYEQHIDCLISPKKISSQQDFVAVDSASQTTFFTPIYRDNKVVKGERSNKDRCPSDHSIDPKVLQLISGGIETIFKKFNFLHEEAHSVTFMSDIADNGNANSRRSNCAARSP
jgi:hypothetical protein